MGVDEWLVKPTFEGIKEGVKEGLANMGHGVWNWFIEVLPELMGFGAMAGGIFIMLGSLVGGTSIGRPVGYLTGGFILSVCILETV